MTERFAIVKFPLEDNKRAVVPLTWVNEEENVCYYPPKALFMKMDNLVKRESVPGNLWSYYKAVVIRKYLTFKAAREDLPRSEDTSNLESDEEKENKRKRKLNTQLKYPGENISSDDDEIESSPPVSKYPYPALHTFSTQRKSNNHNNLSLLQSPPSRSQSSSENHTISHPHTPTPVRSATLSVSPSATPSATHQSRTMTSNEQLNERVVQLQSSVVDIYQLLNSINAKIDHLTSMTTVSDQMLPDDVEQISLLQYLPLTTIDEFNELELKLLDNQQLNKKLMKCYISCGGRDAKSLSLNILKRTFSDQLAMKFSYTGKKGMVEEKTIPFCKTAICQLLQTSVKKVFRNVTEVEVKRITMGFLNQAKTRMIRREQKQDKPLPGMDNNDDDLF